MPSCQSEIQGGLCSRPHLISSNPAAAARLRAARSSTPACQAARWCVPSPFSEQTRLSVSSPPACRDPALLQLWGNADKLVCCDGFLDLPKFSLAIFPWLQTVLILATIVQHREEVNCGGCVKGLLVTFPKQQERC